MRVWIWKIRSNSDTYGVTGYTTDNRRIIIKTPLKFVTSTLNGFKWRIYYVKRVLLSPQYILPWIGRRLFRTFHCLSAALTKIFIQLGETTSFYAYRRLQKPPCSADKSDNKVIYDFMGPNTRGTFCPDNVLQTRWGSASIRKQSKCDLVKINVSVQYVYILRWL